MNSVSNRIAVIGAGSWGTAMAIHLARLQREVNLWGRDASQISLMQTKRQNTYYLPDITFPDNVIPLCDLAGAVRDVKDIIIAVPSHAFRDTLISIKPYFSEKNKLIWLSKGLDPTSNHLLHQVAIDVLGESLCFAVLSGPSFAKEVAMQKPTAVTIASNCYQIRESFVNLFHSHEFRVYYSNDYIGVELGGAVKNVLAIAVGITDGLQCGANAQAALMTRGLAEMMRLGNALGADAQTLMGLSGLGDMILTCTNNQSRNRRFGLAIGQGETKDVAEKAIGQVVEGIKTCAEIYALANKYHVDMPITAQVYQVLHQNLSPELALRNILSRDPKVEN